MCLGPVLIYPKTRLFVRSRKVSKSRDQLLKCTYHFKIWQAHQQHCCRGTCQISVQYQTIVIYKFWGFETLRDLIVRRLIGYWNMSQGQCPIRSLIVGSHLQSPEAARILYPAGTWRNYNIIMKSKWGRDIILMSYWFYYCVMYALGTIALKFDRHLGNNPGSAADSCRGTCQISKQCCWFWCAAKSACESCIVSLIQKEKR